jgi:hypothetical protein
MVHTRVTKFLDTNRARAARRAATASVVQHRTVSDLADEIELSDPEHLIAASSSCATDRRTRSVGSTRPALNRTPAVA